MNVRSRWVVLGESCQGTSHQRLNTVCQDTFRVQVCGPESEWLIAVVADGAGSARHSEIGAALICQELIRQLSATPSSAFTREAVLGFLKTARDAVFCEAEQLGVRPRDLACTVTFAIVGSASAAFGQVGDGSIVIGQHEQFTTVFWPTVSEYANATDFVTDDRFESTLQFHTLEGTINQVALLTDGLQRLALDFATHQPHAAFFRPFFESLANTPDSLTLKQPLREFLDSPRVNQRTDDDKTLVLAVRVP